MLTSKHMLNKSIKASSHEGFKTKWVENVKDEEGNESKKELENYRCKMSHIEGVESHANRDLINHSIDHKAGDGIVAIVNSCDGVVHPITRHCDRTILTQSIGVLTSNAIIK